MATENAIGKVEVASIGNTKIIGVDGVARDVTYEGLVYEGEQIVSDNPNTLFQIRYFALPEATVYEGVFAVLADGSVISDISLLETLFGEGYDLDFLETEAGEVMPDSNSGIPEDAGLYAESSVQDFNRGEGLGNVLRGSALNNGEDLDVQTLPRVTSSNVIVTLDNPDNNPDDEPDTEPNSIPIINDDTVTKVADADFVHRSQGTWSQNNIYVVSSDGTATLDKTGSSLGIITTNDNSDNIDGHGTNETIGFTFSTLLSGVTISIDDPKPGNDVAEWRVYNGDVLVDSGTYTSAGANTPIDSFTISDVGLFDRVEITASDYSTDFRISAIDGYGFDVKAFVIDQDFLLANDTDANGDTLSIASVTDGTKGTVSIDSDGNVVYTPNDLDAVYEGEDAYDTFTYTITDGIDASGEATVTINLDTGQVESADVVTSYLGDSEFLIGTDGADALVVSNTLDLSNMSGIETIQLEDGATVTGSGNNLGITISDLISATSTDSLIIESSDGLGTDNLVAVDTSTFTNISADADYNIFSDGTSTLLIDIDIPIDAV